MPIVDRTGEFLAIVEGIGAVDAGGGANVQRRPAAHSGRRAEGAALREMRHFAERVGSATRELQSTAQAMRRLGRSMCKVSDGGGSC